MDGTRVEYGVVVYVNSGHDYGGCEGEIILEKRCYFTSIYFYIGIYSKLSELRPQFNHPHGGSVYQGVSRGFTLQYIYF